MITLKYIMSKIARITEGNDTLNEKEIDTLYKLIAIKNDMLKDRAYAMEEYEPTAEVEEDCEWTEEKAEEWVSKMVGVDGSGEHWTMNETNSVMRQRGIKADPIEFYATMNMLYSDFARVAKKMGVNNADYWSMMADAFLHDRDAKPNKLWNYYKYVVEDEA